MKNSLLKLNPSAVATIAIAMACTANAFVGVDDFEERTPGAIHSQGSWVATQQSQALLVAQDPDRPANQVLQIGDGFTQGNKTLYNNGITHNPNDAATLFFRFRTAAMLDPNSADMSIGMTIQNPPGNNFNFQSQVGILGGPNVGTLQEPVFPAQFVGRNGGASTRDTGGFYELASGVWYNVWIAMDHVSERYSVYLQGPEHSGPTLMFEAQDPLAYRVATGGEALQAVFLRTGNATKHLGPFYVDDIYFDATTLNLNNPLLLEVEIDIKPGSYPNSINRRSQGVVPVAILSSLDFDAAEVDPWSVTLSGATVKFLGNGLPQAALEDVNADGLLDLVLHVSTQDLQLTLDDSDAELRGATYDGQPIIGRDTVRIAK